MIEIGDTVQVKNTTHITTVKGKEGIWYILEEKAPEDGTNYYGSHQLIKIEKDEFQ